MWFLSFNSASTFSPGQFLTIPRTFNRCTPAQTSRKLMFKNFKFHASTSLTSSVVATGTPSSAMVGSFEASIKLS